MCEKKLAILLLIVGLVCSLVQGDYASEQTIASLNSQATYSSDDPFADSSDSSATFKDTTSESALLAKIAAENAKIQEQNAKLAKLTVKKIAISSSTETTQEEKTKKLQFIAKKMETVKLQKTEAKKEVKVLETKTSVDSSITFHHAVVVPKPVVAAPAVVVPKPVVAAPAVVPKPVVAAPAVVVAPKPVAPPKMPLPSAPLPVPKPLPALHHHYHHHHHALPLKTLHHLMKKLKLKLTKKRRRIILKKFKRKLIKRPKSLRDQQLLGLRLMMDKEFAGIYKRINSHTTATGRRKVKAKAERLFKEEAQKALSKLQSPPAPKILTTGMPTKQVITITTAPQVQPDGSRAKLIPAVVDTSGGGPVAMRKAPQVSSSVVAANNKLQLGKGWKNMGFDLKSASAKVIGGVCYLSGTVKREGAGVSNLIAQLPTICRPTGRLVFSAVANGVPARVDVTRKGQVVLIASAFAVRWVSLDGLSFYIQTRPNFVFVNRWRSYGFGYRLASVQYDKGVCTFSGLIRNGRPTYLGVLKGDTAKCIPKERLVFSVNNHLHSIRVDVLPNGFILAVGPPRIKHRWISLDGISYHRRGGDALLVQKPWYNFGDVRAKSKFRKANFKVTGRICRLSGLLYSKKWTPQSVITKLPKNCRPFKRIIFGQSTQLGIARIDVMPNGRVQFVYARKRYNWLSLEGIKFVVYRKSLSAEQKRRHAAIKQLFQHYETLAHKEVSHTKWAAQMSTLRQKVLEHLEQLKLAGASKTEVVKLQRYIDVKTQQVNAAFQSNISKLEKQQLALEIRTKKLKAELLQKHREKLYKHKRKRYFERKRKQILEESNRKRLKGLEEQEKFKRRMIRKKREEQRKRKRREVALKEKARKQREEERKRRAQLHEKEVKKTAESLRNAKIKEAIHTAVKVADKKLVEEKKEVKTEKAVVKMEKKAEVVATKPVEAAKPIPVAKPKPKQAIVNTASFARCKKALISYVKRGKLLPQCGGAAKASCLVQRKKFQKAMMVYLQASCSKIGKKSTNKACAVAVAIYSKNIDDYITKCNNLKGHNLAVCNSKLNLYKSWYRPVKAICFNSYV